MNNTTGHAHDATAWLQLARRLQKQQLQQFSQLGELASQLSALVHMLQCERGASNIYLCSGGLLYTAECRAGGDVYKRQAIPTGVRCRRILKPRR